MTGHRISLLPASGTGGGNAGGTRYLTRWLCQPFSMHAPVDERLQAGRFRLEGADPFEGTVCGLT